jgi:hypothetical protein
VFLPDMGVFIQFFEAIKMACNLTKNSNPAYDFCGNLGEANFQ